MRMGEEGMFHDGEPLFSQTAHISPATLAAGTGVHMLISKRASEEKYHLSQVGN